jgi:hypothetical protein
MKRHCSICAVVMSIPKPSVYPGPLYNEDGGSIFLRNAGTHIPHYRQQVLPRFNAISDTKLKKVK